MKTRIKNSVLVNNQRDNINNYDEKNSITCNLDNYFTNFL